MSGAVIIGAKRIARRLVERSLVPHLDDQVAQIDQVVARRLAEHDGHGSTVADSLVLTDFNHLLHELRTIELRSLPVNGGVLLSAGCAGLWYFDWIRDNVPDIGHHVGVELYEDRPAGLPADVTWLAQSASAMPDVADGSVDVVFSGQNFEHLARDDMADFLLESNRVLRTGGTLVVDSPNRLAVEALHWTHPEHTIEITAAEARSVFEAAGFRVSRSRGLWNCRDRRTGEWQVLAPEPGDAAAMLERSVGERDIDDDFVWWIEAERTADADGDRVRTEVAELFDRHWNVRVNRGVHCIGERMTAGGWRMPAGSTGLIYATRPLPVFAGPTEVRASHPMLRVRVVDSDGIELASGDGRVRLEPAATAFGVTVELIADRALDETISGVGVEITAP